MVKHCWCRKTLVGFMQVYPAQDMRAYRWYTVEQDRVKLCEERDDTSDLSKQYQGSNNKHWRECETVWKFAPPRPSSDKFPLGKLFAIEVFIVFQKIYIYKRKTIPDKKKMKRSTSITDYSHQCKCVYIILYYSSPLLICCVWDPHLSVAK